MAIGTVSITATGNAQLSYCAARKRKPKMNAAPKMKGVRLPAAFCCWVTPDHSKPIWAGRSWRASRSISSLAAPVLTPGRPSPVTVDER